MLRKIPLTLLLLHFAIAYALAQNITVSGALVGNGSYPTLTAAFAAINSGAQTGANITLSVLNDTYEGSGTAVLNAGAWASLQVVPVGQPRSIIGATTGGSPMIHLNGADSVTFAGALAGQKALTLHNTTASSVPGTATVRLFDAASHNTFQDCRILGASQVDIQLEGGNIVFANGSPFGSPYGNSYNTINRCDIGPGGSTLPTHLVYCGGGSQLIDINAYNSVLNSDLFDCFGSTQSSASVHIRQGAKDWLIDNNRFYQTAPRTMTASGGTHCDILMTSSNGYAHTTASNNTFGSLPLPAVGGTTITFQSSDGCYIPISFAGINPIGDNYVLNNTIRDITVHSTATTGQAIPFIAIQMLECDGESSGNLIGSTTTAASIVVTGMQTGSTTARAIIIGNSNFNQGHRGNMIGGIDVTNSNGGAARFLGIVGGDANYNSSIVLYANVIGYLNAPIRVTGSGVANSIVGISAFGLSVSVQDNTVAHLNTNVPANFTPSGMVMSNFAVTGIYADNFFSFNSDIQRNHVHSLSNTHPTAATSIVGIQANNVSTIADNRVHSLGLSTNNPQAVVIGINVLQGDLRCVNNMVRLGYTASGLPISTGMRIFGIRNLFGTPMLHHNSIYVGGTSVTDTSDTYALYSLSAGSITRLMNNIFYNARSNGSGTGTHYAIRSGTLTTSAISNGNDLLADGVGGMLGFYAGQDRSTIFDWRLATGQDFNSISHDPNFINPAGTALTGDLHLGPVSPAEGAGVPGSPPNLDIDQQARISLSPVDIGADADNYQPLAVQVPEAHLTGNTLPIADGDTSPISADGTDFGTGAGCIDVSITRTFVLRNIGNASLLISGVNVSGSSYFTVLPPSPTTVLPGQSTNIVVQFTPTIPGPASATITVLTNDSDESSYTFDVYGIRNPDTIAPTAVCQNISLPIASNGIGIVPGAALGTGSTDNCSIASYVASPAQFTCAQIGPHAVQLTVSDPSGLSATCNATVTVVDATAPQAQCQNITLTLDAAGTAQATIAALNNNSTDNCGIDSIWASNLTFTCAQIGTHPVQLSVRDLYGQIGTCTATVTITDGQPPVAACQAVTLLLDSQGQALLSPTLVDAGSTDNCAIVGRTLSQTAFTCADVGTQPVVLTLTDAAGNAATCSTSITIQDNIAPVLSCANVTLTVPSSGSVALSPATVGSATDACGIAGYQLSQAQFSCADLGSTPISLIASDPSGNSDTCTVVLTVLATPLATTISASAVDSCGHHIACAGQATASATVGASGACAPYTYAWSDGQTGATASGLGAGSYSVTVTALDGQQQVQTITLTAPAPLVASLTSTPSCLSSHTGSVTALATGGQSCQGYTYLWSNGLTSASINGLAPGVYTLTLTDASGCVTQATATVTAWPNPGLSITQVQNNLVASLGFVSYQWYLGGNLIPGATNAQVTPLSTGFYQVVAVDSMGCSWTSADLFFNYVGTSAALPGWEAITLYPNPGQGVFRFAVGQAIDGPIWLRVTDLSGKVLLREELAVLESGRAFDLSWVAAGVYLVELRAEDGQQRRFRLLRE